MTANELCFRQSKDNELSGEFGLLSTTATTTNNIALKTTTKDYGAHVKSNEVFNMWASYYSCIFIFSFVCFFFISCVCVT